MKEKLVSIGLVMLLCVACGGNSDSSKPKRPPAPPVDECEGQVDCEGDGTIDPTLPPGESMQPDCEGGLVTNSSGQYACVLEAWDCCWRVTWDGKELHSRLRHRCDKSACLPDEEP